MRSCCSVLDSTVTPRPGLGHPGSGVYATRTLRAGTCLFWRCATARLLCFGATTVTLRRYAMVYVYRPRHLDLLCPSAADFADRDDPKGRLHLGWRVNFTGPGDAPTCILDHAGLMGDRLCYRTLRKVRAGEELTYCPQFYVGLPVIQTLTRKDVKARCYV
jgi:hypothetical protein